jgi:hypothetical protein
LIVGGPCKYPSDARNSSAFVVGDFVNSIILARRKVIDQGRAYWKRAILSTVCGQLVDSLIFYPLEFSGLWSVHIGITHDSLKVAIEVVGVAFSYWVCVAVKRAEGVDYFGSSTAFNPFGLKAGTPNDKSQLAYSSRDDSSLSYLRRYAAKPKSQVRLRTNVAGSGTVV